MAEEQKPHSPPPHSPLERMLRSALRLRRAGIHFFHAADEEGGAS